MTLVHKCNECRFCFNCGSPNCTTYFPPNEIKVSREDNWIIKRCYNCGEILEKYKLFNLDRDKKDE